jgi:hypothetical protein
MESEPFTKGEEYAKSKGLFRENPSRHARLQQFSTAGKSYGFSDLLFNGDFGKPA